MHRQLVLYQCVMLTVTSVAALLLLATLASHSFQGVGGQQHRDAFLYLRPDAQSPHV